MIFCACDPDTKTPAFALFNQTRLAASLLLKSTKSEHWLVQLPELIDSWRPELLVIENQWVPNTRGNSAAIPTILNLAAARGMIEAMFLFRNIPNELVNPLAWQRTLGGSALGRQALKTHSLIKATSIAGHKITNDHVADAINIGLWWASIRASERGWTPQKITERNLAAAPSPNTASQNKVLTIRRKPPKSGLRAAHFLEVP